MKGVSHPGPRTLICRHSIGQQCPSRQRRHGAARHYCHDPPPHELPCKRQRRCHAMAMRDAVRCGAVRCDAMRCPHLVSPWLQYTAAASICFDPSAAMQSVGGCRPCHTLLTVAFSPTLQMRKQTYLQNTQSFPPDTTPSALTPCLNPCPITPLSGF